MVIFSEELTEIEKTKKIEEISGKLGKTEEDKLMHTVLEGNKRKIDEGKLVNDAINKGINSFNPDSMFKQLISSYRLTKDIYGETLIRILSGYDPKYVEKNIKIPEFQRDLRKKIAENVDSMKEEGILDKNYMITDKGIKLASLILYMEELDELVPKGIFGEKIHKKQFIYGGKEDIKIFKNDRYRDIALRSSVKTAIRRGHGKLEIGDLRAFEKKAKGQVYIIYGLDASGSMKGKKIEAAKKAGIALAYKAISQKDKVGLVVFGSDVKSFVDPTLDFSLILDRITRIRASKETDLVVSIKKSVELFTSANVTKHFILLTDALQTIGTEKDVLDAVGLAKEAGITISIVGINLDKKGEKLAKEISELGSGRFYVVKDIENVDKVILEDYYSIF